MLLFLSKLILVFDVNATVLMLDYSRYNLEQWSARCTLVHTSVHEISFRVHEIFGVHETCFRVHEFFFCAETKLKFFFLNFLHLRYFKP